MWWVVLQWSHKTPAVKQLPLYLIGHSNLCSMHHKKWTNNYYVHEREKGINIVQNTNLEKASSVEQTYLDELLVLFQSQRLPAEYNNSACAYNEEKFII